MEYASACSNLGFLYQNGKGVRQNYKKAKELYTRACDAGDANGCHNLGVFYVNGKGVKQDKRVAKEYFCKTCDMGEQSGCDKYKILNEQGW
nr:tetratricopeptide repeat protein [uncultured Campylobacter sp.]